MIKKKFAYIKEEDYWVFPLTFLNIIFIALFFYAGVLVFRVPAMILGGIGSKIVFDKIERSYSLKRAWFHWIVSILLSALIALGFYFITN